MAALFAWSSLAVSTHADLISYEGFVYPASANLTKGANGGVGWAHSWSANGSGTFVATSPGFSFNALEVGGNHAVLAATGPAKVVSVRRTNETVYNAGTVYLSFLSQVLQDGPRGGGAAILDGAGDEAAFISGSGGAWGVSAGGPKASTEYESSDVSLLVLKIEFDYDGFCDRLSLAVNPSPGAPEPGRYDAVIEGKNIGSFGSLRFNAGFTNDIGTVIAFDEIRIGDTFADVVPAM